jgi:hypothetical protein
MGLKLVPSHRLRMYVNRVLRNTSGPQKDAVTGYWRRLHKSEELHNLYSSPNIIQGIIARKMQWAEHVAPMGERRSVYRIVVGKQKQRDHLEDLGIEVMIILKLFFKK